jgi:hypothetical protein
MVPYILMLNLAIFYHFLPPRCHLQPLDIAYLFKIFDINKLPINKCCFSHMQLQVNLHILDKMFTIIALFVEKNLFIDIFTCLKLVVKKWQVDLSLESWCRL